MACVATMSPRKSVSLLRSTARAGLRPSRGNRPVVRLKVPLPGRAQCLSFGHPSKPRALRLLGRLARASAASDDAAFSPGKRYVKLLSIPSRISAVAHRNPLGLNVPFRSVSRQSQGAPPFAHAIANACRKSHRLLKYGTGPRHHTPGCSDLRPRMRSFSAARAPAKVPRAVI
jgi:hypothetical protein